MESCDRRTRAYKNGKTFDQCRKIAESFNPDFKKNLKQGAPRRKRRKNYHFIHN